MWHTTPRALRHGRSHAALNRPSIEAVSLENPQAAKNRIGRCRNGETSCRKVDDSHHFAYPCEPPTKFALPFSPFSKKCLSGKHPVGCALPTCTRHLVVGCAHPTNFRTASKIAPPSHSPGALGTRKAAFTPSAETAINSRSEYFSIVAGTTGPPTVLRHLLPLHIESVVVVLVPAASQSLSENHRPDWEREYFDRLSMSSHPCRWFEHWPPPDGSVLLFVGESGCKSSSK